jgi:peptide/nickel transport system ATP-binding protein
MTETRAPLLEVKDLQVVFDTEAGPARAVDGISFTLEPGETLGLVGESGCGKTVTALAMLRLVPSPGRIAGGSIRYRGRNLLELDTAALRRVRGREIAMVFQDPVSALNPVLSCGSQLEEVVRVHQGCSRHAARERAFELLDRVHLADARRVARAYPHELSGGMCQRVMLAMALAGEPSVLVADEPTTALDVTIQAQICELLQELQAASGMALLLITHDLGLVAGMAARVAIMYAGRIVEQAPAPALFAAPRHPYTLGLLHSLLGRASATGRLPGIPGVVPDPARLPTHCRFQPRCPVRVDRCAREDPPERLVGPAHSTCCFVDIDPAGPPAAARSTAPGAGERSQ